MAPIAIPLGKNRKIHLCSCWDTRWQHAPRNLVRGTASTWPRHEYQGMGDRKGALFGTNLERLQDTNLWRKERGVPTNLGLIGPSRS